MSAIEPERVHREQSNSGPIIVVGLFFVLLLLYILSPPFAYLLVGGPLNASPVCRAIYMPLIYLDSEFPWVRDFYAWYGSLFPWSP